MHVFRFFSCCLLCCLLSACLGKFFGTQSENPTDPAAPTNTQPMHSPETASQPDSANASVADSDTMRDIQQLWTGSVCSNPQEAVTRLDSVLQATPGNAQALALRGLALSQMSGKRDAAFDDLTAAVKSSPTARHYAWRGLASMRGGNTRAAQSDAKYALRKDPGDPVGHMVLGMLAQEEGRTQDACSSLLKACQGGECSALDAARKQNMCPR